MPGEGLRPDGIEEDETPNEYPSGATMNVSMWDMIEREVPELGNERRLQGSSSSASPGKEKRSAGDRKRDRKWREYLEALAAEAAQGAKGGTPAPSPQRASGGHHPGHTTLGDFLEVAKQAKAKPRPLHLRKSRPSSDVESAHRGRMPADQASSSSSVAPDQRDVARACERACGVPCNLLVLALSSATFRRAASMASFLATSAWALAVASAWALSSASFFALSWASASSSAFTSASLQTMACWARRVSWAAAATSPLTRAVAASWAAAAVRPAAMAATVEAWKAMPLPLSVASSWAMPTAPSTAAFCCVARCRATEAELAALETEKARLQRAVEAEAACAWEEAERRAAAATAAALEEAEAKLRRETPPGGSRVVTLRRLFEEDASSKMTLDLEEVDTGSSGDSGPTAYRRRKGKGKTPDRSRRPAGGHPHDSDPFFTASDGDERGRRHRRGVAGGGGGDVPLEPEGEGEDLPPPYRSSESSA